ncbi:hypothetical protein LC082_02355 [Microbacterium esteraromaticum]|nr:hypothetical protein [Microbacterium esteraromaticum]MCA1305740.1 hypothetical protein [Microbacterium esteraromaticum]
MMTSPAKTAAGLRAAATLTGAGLALAMLAGCSPQPEPTPTETPLFASEEAAFAAAEETYQAYIAAGNAVDLGAPESFESVFNWLSDAALASAKKSYSTMHAEGLVLEGTTTFDSFDLKTHTSDEVVAELCADVSDVAVRSSDGESLVPADRIDRQHVEVRFAPSQTRTGLTIARSTYLGEDSC